MPASPSRIATRGPIRPRTKSSRTPTSSSLPVTDRRSIMKLSAKARPNSGRSQGPRLGVEARRQTQACNPTATHHESVTGPPRSGRGSPIPTRVADARVGHVILDRGDRPRALGAPRRKCCYRLDASAPIAAPLPPARDDTQSSAAVLSSRLVSAVGASMSDRPCVRSGTHRGTSGMSRDRRALHSATQAGKGRPTSQRFKSHDAPSEARLSG